MVDEAVDEFTFDVHAVVMEVDLSLFSDVFDDLDVIIDHKHNHADLNHILKRNCPIIRVLINRHIREMMFNHSCEIPFKRN